MSAAAIVLSKATSCVRNIAMCVLASFAPVVGVRAQQHVKTLLPILEQAQRDRWMLRIEDANGQTLQGLAVVRSDTLVRIGRSEVDVRRMERVLHGSREGSGALPGALLGGVVLGGTALAMTAGCIESCGGKWTIVMFGAGVGSFVGLVVGELTNPGHVVWKEVWR